MPRKNPLNKKIGLQIKIFATIKVCCARVIDKAKTFFRAQAKKEVTLFTKTTRQVTFKPFHVVQGFVVLLLLATIASFFVPSNKTNSVAVIKSAQLKQLSLNIAGRPTQWTILVNKSDITKQNYLAKLPRNAQNIKVTTITKKQAKAILSTQPKQLSLKEKNQLALANQPKSFFAADLLDSITKFLVADISDATQTVIDSTDPNITQTTDATTVDLSGDTDSGRSLRTDRPRNWPKPNARCIPAIS